ncbi:MAG TPA: alpha/beta hydrolase [Lichenihabitans sp.]|jgi:2,6-dihydroxypseudooxynicotine hydrolase|nr:alpha/beta hydrolase [Lichenihabitans sp.]
MSAQRTSVEGGAPDEAPAGYVSATYLMTTVPNFLRSITYRMLADGLLLQDIRAAEVLDDWAEWGEFWIDRALGHEQLATEALASGRTTTASQHLVRASLCAHYAQFLYFDFPGVKKRAVELKARLYGAAAALLSPPTTAVEIPFRNGSLPGYLRVPAGASAGPAVILIGGLDAAKEDAHQFSDLCLERGVATLAFDGPGQGEAFYRGHLFGADFHRSVSAAIDLLGAHAAIDAERIGVLGRSLGGFLAPQAAALDHRIKACVAWGALYDLGSFDHKPPLIQKGYRFITGAADMAEAKARASFVDLSGIAEKITCPLYVVHGMKDNSVPPDNAERLARQARGAVHLRLVPDSIHCNHDVAHVVRPAMADWLAETLR